MHMWLQASSKFDRPEKKKSRTFLFFFWHAVTVCLPDVTTRQPSREAAEKEKKSPPSCQRSLREERQGSNEAPCLEGPVAPNKLQPVQEVKLQHTSR